MLTMNRAALEAHAELLKKDIEQLRLENSVLLSYNEKKTAELGADDEDKKKKKNKKNLVSQLTSEQKLEIANIVHEDLIAEIDAHRKNAEKMIDTLRAVLEETEIRIGELKRDAYEFKRDVVVGAENNRTGKIMAERVVRYFDDKFKQTDAVIEKLRLKNSTLKSQISKLEATLAQKEEVGDALHYIDFHQLQIENKQYVAKIEERNDELLAVKHASSKTTQALNDYKQRLHVQLENADWLKTEIQTKEGLLIKLENEQKKVQREIFNEKKLKNKLRSQLEEAAEMPNIEDYIAQKRELQNLELVKKNWQKKVEIMEMAAKRTKSLTQKLQSVRK
ncbi:DUF4201 domain-containing protein [archaeon]|nr:MAG: DUF4201 domain-containing protein [archaeon]